MKTFVIRKLCSCNPEVKKGEIVVLVSQLSREYTANTKMVYITLCEKESIWKRRTERHCHWQISPLFCGQE